MSFSLCKSLCQLLDHIFILLVLKKLLRQGLLVEVKPGTPGLLIFLELGLELLLEAPQSGLVFRLKRTLDCIFCTLKIGLASTGLN